VDTTNPNIKPLITVLLKVDQRGLTCAQIQAVDDDWRSKAGLKQFDMAVTEKLNSMGKRCPGPQILERDSIQVQLREMCNY
jgi:isocitrate lyase